MLSPSEHISFNDLKTQISQVVKERRPFSSKKTSFGTSETQLFSSPTE